MATPEATPAIEASVVAEAQESTHRLRRFLGAAAVTLTCGLAGGGAGAIVGLETPAHVEVASSSADAYARPSQPYHQFGIDHALTLRIPNNNSYVGGSVSLNSIPNLQPNGHFDATLAAEYLQLFSDRKLIASNVSWAVKKHILEDALLGAAVGMGMYGGRSLLRRSYERHFTADEQAKIHEFVRPKVHVARYAVGLLVLSALLPNGDVFTPTYRTLHADPIFAGTALEGSELDGPLAPLIDAGGDFIRTYLSDTDKSYATLEKNALAYIDAGNIELPTGPHLRTFLFYSDKHCNIGIDRVNIAIMRKLGLKVLVSAGDDAASGSFPFESACTSGLMDRAHKYGITVVDDDGNHDSAMTMRAKLHQGMIVLDNKIITVKDNGEPFNFIGSSDPRQSRYGHGIVPASHEAQTAVTTTQGEKLGEIACEQDKPLIAIPHDPNAGLVAAKNGCGRIILVLDGHTHRHTGPTSIDLPTGSTAYQIVAGSGGGAPAPGDPKGLEQAITVGPPQHQISLDLITVDTRDMSLVQDTELMIQPDLSISSHQVNLGEPIDRDVRRPEVVAQPGR